jgi:nickel/cobalt exporter
MRIRTRPLKQLIFLLAVIAWPSLGQRGASAHPLDQLTQHLFVHLQSTEVDLTVAVGGGLLANELVLSQLDKNGDQVITPAEETTWLELWTKTLKVTLDQKIVPVSSDRIQITVPPVQDFHVGTSPIMLSFTVPLPAVGEAADHLLSVRNEYLINRTAYRINVDAGNGTKIVDQSWPGAAMRIAFNADPSVAAGGNSSAAEAAREWSGSRVLDRARRALEHDRTPAFMLVLLGIFALMGALHAMQPGHGKTLVAAYLVATGGTPRDALALAGIVTFTHTISVFALGLATLAASEIFLPSKVIPVMGAISGLLVAIMGINMFRSAMIRLRRTQIHGHLEEQHHHHDHAHLTDDEHERLHLEEALQIRSGVSRRSLVTLGVSGGLAPCPDALAILLLAIGMNQAGLGMIAIIAFSSGLATVLVAFGLAVSLLGPAWNRLKSGGSGESWWMAGAFSRFTTFAPVGSACIVLLLGIAMAWRSVNSG